MAQTGRFVMCHAWAPKKGDQPHQVDRALCLAQPYKYCPECPNSTFVLRLPVGAGNEQVACPRWDVDADMLRGQKPKEYVPVRREVCLTRKPFQYCPSCPNSRPEEMPRVTPGWYK